MDGGLLSLKWNNHRSSFIHVLSSLRKKDSFCDVTIACDGKFYPSHKFVLSTCSEYFQDMFHHTECKHPIIVLKDIRSDDLEALLNYMYVGEVNVVQEKLSSLIKAAECLRIKGLAVPDDPPRETSDKRGGSHHDSFPESKRRRADSDHPRNKDHSHSSKGSTKSSESSYKQSTVQANFDPPRGQSGITETYNYANEDSGNDYTNKGENTRFIKQEPLEDLVELEDTKEGILESAQSSFLTSGTSKQSSQNEGLPLPTSESQEIWCPDGRSGDDYPPLDEGDSCDATNEDSSQNETAMNDGTIRSSSSFHSSTSSSSSVFPSASSYSRTSPHVCSRCHYVARDKTNLRKHIFTHTGEKPFTCDLCDYKTTQSSNLRSHFRRRHAHRAPNLFEEMANIGEMSPSNREGAEVDQRSAAHFGQQICNTFQTSGQM